MIRIVAKMWIDESSDCDCKRSVREITSATSGMYSTYLEFKDDPCSVVFVILMKDIGHCSFSLCTLHNEYIYVKSKIITKAVFFLFLHKFQNK